MCDDISLFAPNRSIILPSTNSTKSNIISSKLNYRTIPYLSLSILVIIIIIIILILIIIIIILFITHHHHCCLTPQGLSGTRQGGSTLLQLSRLVTPATFYAIFREMWCSSLGAIFREMWCGFRWSRSLVGILS